MGTIRYFAVAVFGWIQLGLSILLLGAVVWAYDAYRSSAGELSQAVANSVLSASELIENIAFIIQTRQQVVSDVTSTLQSSRAVLVTLRETTVNQQKLLPQYAENMKYASTVTASLSDRIGKMGQALMFKVPTRVEMEGIKPILVLTRPLKEQAAAFQDHAKNIQTLSNSLSKLSETISKDAQKNISGLLDLCDQSIRLLDGTSKSIDQLRAHDIPDAVQKLQSATKQLKRASGQVQTFDNFSWGLLIIGILLSFWMSLQSISQIMLAKNLKNSGQGTLTALPGKANSR